MFLVSVECISTCKIQHVYKSILLFLFRDLFVRLKDSGKVNGFMIIENTPNAYSPDAKCPNDQSGKDFIVNKYKAFLYVLLHSVDSEFPFSQFLPNLATNNADWWQKVIRKAYDFDHECMFLIWLLQVEKYTEENLKFEWYKLYNLDRTCGEILTAILCVAFKTNYMDFDHHLIYAWCCWGSVFSLNFVWALVYIVAGMYRNTNYSSCAAVTWNPVGNGLMWADLSLPVFILTSQADVTFIIEQVLAWLERVNAFIRYTCSYYPYQFRLFKTINYLLLDFCIKFAVYSAFNTLGEIQLI